jgi:hypothetical protein
LDDRGQSSDGAQHWTCDPASLLPASSSVRNRLRLKPPAGFEHQPFDQAPKVRFYLHMRLVSRLKILRERRGLGGCDCREADRQTKRRHWQNSRPTDGEMVTKSLHVSARHLWARGTWDTCIVQSSVTVYSQISLQLSACDFRVGVTHSPPRKSIFLLSFSTVCA